MSAVPVRVAARALGVTATCVRRWVARGAPAVSRRPILVSVEAIRTWRRGTDPLHLLASALLETFRREAVRGMPAHRVLGIPDRAAAVLLLAVFDRAHHAITGTEAARPWLPEVAQLRRFAGGSD